MLGSCSKTTHSRLDQVFHFNIRPACVRSSSYETNIVVSSKNISSRPSTAKDSNSFHEKEGNNLFSETNRDQHSLCQATLHGLNTRGARTFLIYQKGMEIDCIANYKGECNGLFFSKYRFNII